jgi:hypothetical protein
MDHATKLSLIEAVQPDIAPFSDQVHALMLDGVSKIADQWIEQLTILRKSADALEAQIISCVAKTKSDISALHDLGAKVAAEAMRGQEVCKQLSDSIEKIAS